MSGLDPLQKPASAELLSRAASVKLLVFDVDGVLTDGGLYYGPSGEALKRFDVKDGHALVMARLVGLPGAVLTARTSSIVEIRARELRLAAVAQGKKDKVLGLREILEQLGTPAEACAYMGDDVNDLGALQMAGLPSCPADAAAEVRSLCFLLFRLGFGGPKSVPVRVVAKDFVMEIESELAELP